MIPLPQFNSLSDKNCISKKIITNFHPIPDIKTVPLHDSKNQMNLNYLLEKSKDFSLESWKIKKKLEEYSLSDNLNILESNQASSSDFFELSCQPEIIINSPANSYDWFDVYLKPIMGNFDGVNPGIYIWAVWMLVFIAILVRIGIIKIIIPNLDSYVNTGHGEGTTFEHICRRSFVKIGREAQEKMKSMMGFLKKAPLNLTNLLNNVLKELKLYIIQRKKFANIIKRINKKKENFFPDESKLLFNTYIILIDVLIRELESRALSLTSYIVLNFFRKMKKE